MQISRFSTSNPFEEMEKWLVESLHMIVMRWLCKTLEGFSYSL